MTEEQKEELKFLARLIYSCEKKQLINGIFFNVSEEEHYPCFTLYVDDIFVISWGKFKTNVNISFSFEDIKKIMTLILELQEKEHNHINSLLKEKSNEIKNKIKDVDCSYSNIIIHENR